MTEPRLLSTPEERKDWLVNPMYQQFIIGSQLRRAAQDVETLLLELSRLSGAAEQYLGSDSYRLPRKILELGISQANKLLASQEPK